MTTVSIEFISDFICPWCYIGISRIARINSLLEGEIVLNIRMKPYSLYPSIPKGGVPKSRFASRTNRGKGKALKSEATVENIQINYKSIENIPNSLEAHRLSTLISSNDEQFRFSQKVFSSYFELGLNIEDHDLLENLALEVGVQADVLDSFKNSNMGEDKCKASIEKSKDEFISVVPAVKFHNNLLMPGLQPEEVWIKYFRRAAVLQKK